MATVLYAAPKKLNPEKWGDVYMAVISNGGEFTSQEEHEVALLYIQNEFKDQNIEFSTENIHFFSIEENGERKEMRFEIVNVPEFTIGVKEDQPQEDDNLINIDASKVVENNT